MNFKHLFFTAERLKQHSKKQYLNDSEAMKELGDHIWKIMEDAYAPIGGYGAAEDINGLIAKSYLWKVITSEGQEFPLAFRAYKKQKGLKVVASATNRDPRYRTEARSAYASLVKEDLKRAWGEYSGGSLRYVLKQGGNKYLIPVEEVRKLLPTKDILPVYDEEGNEDKYQYQRELHGKIVTKTAVGTHR